MSIKMGIQKRQWVILLLLVSLPLLLNAVAIQQQISTKGFLQLFMGAYHPSNPNLPFASPSEILSGLLIFAAILGAICWLVIFVSNETFFQKQSVSIKILESLLVVLGIAKIFEIATGFFMPLVWLPQFGDYLLGIPGSDFMMHWSMWFIFPATAVILFVGIQLSRNKNLESKKTAETVNKL